MLSNSNLGVRPMDKFVASKLLPIYLCTRKNPFPDESKLHSSPDCYLEKGRWFRRFPNFTLSCPEDRVTHIAFGCETFRLATLLHCLTDSDMCKRLWPKDELSLLLGYKILPPTPAYNQIRKKRNTLADISIRLGSEEQWYGPFIKIQEEIAGTIQIEVAGDCLGCLFALKAGFQIQDVPPYFMFPVKLLPISRRYKLPECYAAWYLVREPGVSDYVSKTDKLFRFCLSDLVNVMGLGRREFSTACKICYETLAVLEADRIIHRIKPGLSMLLGTLRGSKARKQQLEIYVKHTELLDQDLGDLLIKRGIATD